MIYPKYVEVNGKRYDINTDFRVAIKCDEIGRDESISKYERPLAIIYLLFGEEALKDYENHEQLLELAKKFLSCNKEVENGTDADMDLVEDFDYIKASFRSDYSINLNEESMHWWEFCNLLNGLSNNELGNCCILNRVRNIRSFDISKIKDPKEKRKMVEAKKMVELKKHKKPKKEPTTQQKQSAMELYNALNLERS